MKFVAGEPSRRRPFPPPIFFHFRATVAAAGAREAKRAGDGRHDDPAASGSFQDHAAFRDAMDDLGLLVGLGQQEVLTLVRGWGCPLCARKH